MFYGVTPQMMEDRNEFNKKVAAKEVGEVPSAFFVKQVIRNACGTIGLIRGGWLRLICFLWTGYFVEYYAFLNMLDACCNSNIELKKGSMMEKLKSGHFKSSDAERGWFIICWDTNVIIPGLALCAVDWRDVHKKRFVGVFSHSLRTFVIWSFPHHSFFFSFFDLLQGNTKSKLSWLRLN